MGNLNKYSTLVIHSEVHAKFKRDANPMHTHAKHGQTGSVQAYARMHEHQYALAPVVVICRLHDFS